MSSAETKHQGLRIPINSVLPSLGVVSGAGAIVAKACCVLPLTMAGAGMGASSSTIVQAMMPLRVPLLVISALFVAAGWLTYIRDVRARTQDCQCPPAQSGSRRNAFVLSIATLLLATAIAWNVIQPSTIQMAT
jgi:hypothetical protein